MTDDTKLSESLERAIDDYRDSHESKRWCSVPSQARAALVAAIKADREEHGRREYERGYKNASYKNVTPGYTEA